MYTISSLGFLKEWWNLKDTYEKNQIDTESILAFTTLLYQSFAVISHTSNSTAMHIFNDQINEPL